MLILILKNKQRGTAGASYVRVCMEKYVEKQKENPAAWDGMDGFVLLHFLTDCDGNMFAIFLKPGMRIGRTVRTS